MCEPDSKARDHYQLPLNRKQEKYNKIQHELDDKVFGKSAELIERLNLPREEKSSISVGRLFQSKYQ